MQHISWMAAIELGLTREPDRNRFVLLTLQKPPKDKFGKMNLPGKPILAELGHKLLALAIRHGHKADQLSQVLMSHPVDGVDSRIVESYATPAAMLATVWQQDEGAAKTMLERWLRGRDFDGSVTSDEDSLLRTILSSHVDAGQGKRFTVAEGATNGEIFLFGREQLERVGISLCRLSRGPRKLSVSEWTHLFVDTETAKRYLLKGTRWETGDIKEVLLRLAGATGTRLRCNNMKPYGVSIPRATTKLEIEQEQDQTEFTPPRLYANSPDDPALNEVEPLYLPPLPGQLPGGVEPDTEPERPPLAPEPPEPPPTLEDIARLLDTIPRRPPAANAA
jgi:hypothetical protein